MIHPPKKAPPVLDEFYDYLGTVLVHVATPRIPLPLHHVVLDFLSTKPKQTNASKIPTQ